MKKLRAAKIYLFLAALLFVAKPFLGFEMFSKLHPPAEESIFIKAFSKSRPEFSEDNNFNLFEVQKKALTPPPQLFLGISFLLSILFPVVFAAGVKINQHHLRNMQLAVFKPVDTWLLNGHLLI
ncbi:hypothetical protein [Mucilaginibacter gotjawali]|uniref:Uncharacterized protein n=2 Tax=Mucilaginibacter gotjawali TaxID=1550579 RepID=A0A0X8X2K8_9SPHI|nr:hypothetical protein [Mucilaginibacter gotjawali]MBB3055768.1 hypothetical protein [Mucilaginibacter gotjawali]BAU54589.1 hypothetical protein MgSA37_02765 [Mucilaginibacter gotjawali]